MFVQESPPRLDQAHAPDPHQDRAATSGVAPSPTGRLLGLVRKLIDFGVVLVTTLRQGASAATLANVTRYYGIPDVALIIARITRGLQIAAALEARLISGVSPGQLGCAEIRIPSPRAPRIERPSEQDGDEPGRRRANCADARLDRLLTAAAIAAAVRCRPVGAVIADICRDLGILPCHPLWRELTDAIQGNGGNLATLLKDGFKRGEIAFEHDAMFPPFPLRDALTLGALVPFPRWQPPELASPLPLPGGCGAEPPLPAASGAGPP